ncbi:MAG TPA: hypothetical protein VN026_12340 [Bacteroidia bacterium]|jgi:hypothetical protein|nr:hypothetical protein [Bacteroidia bacterium]
MSAKNKIITPKIWIAFIALAFPMLYAYVKKDNKPNLVGIVISDKKPELNSENWLSGSYQKEMDDYNDDHWSLKEITVRLNNQFYYKAFRQIRVNGFVLGKEDYIFSESYIFSAFGDDFIGEQKIISQMQKAKVVQDSLKRHGVDLLFVFAPGKGEYCSEFVEDKYKHPVKNTNHAEFVKQCKNNGVNYLDLYTYFNLLKPNTKYPLFPKFGHHWSYYGEVLASDTIIRHIEALHGKRMAEIAWEKIDVVDTARSRDADALKSMNLYTNPDQNMKLAYPEVLFESDSSKNTTRVLTISDSYWYGPVYMGIGQNCFAGGQFWYYFNKVIPSPNGVKTEVWELNLKQELEQNNNVIMLLYSDGNLPGFGNSFIQDAYEMYTSPQTYWLRMEKNKTIQNYAKQIRNQPGLLKKSTQRSSDFQIPLDSAIKLDAMKMAGMK